MLTRAHDTGESLIITRTQDVQGILEDAKRRHIEGVHGDAEMRHAARLPMVVVENYLHTNGVSWAEFLAEPKHAQAMLNDPALSGFRVWTGREGQG